MVPLRTAPFSSAGVIGSPVNVLLHQMLVDLGEPFDHLLRYSFTLLPHVRRDLIRELFASESSSSVHTSPTSSIGRRAAVLVLAADRDLHRDRMGAQAFTHQVDAW